MRPWEAEGLAAAGRSAAQRCACTTVWAIMALQVMITLLLIGKRTSRDSERG